MTRASVMESRETTPHGGTVNEVFDSDREVNLAVFVFLYPDEDHLR